MPTRVEREDRLRWLETLKDRKAFLVDLTGCPSVATARQRLLGMLKARDPTAQARFVKNAYLRKIYGVDLHHSGLLVVTGLEQIDLFTMTDSIRSFRIPRLGEPLHVPCLVPRGLTTSRPSAIYTALSAKASTKLNRGLVEFVKPFPVGWRGQRTTPFIRDVCAQFGPRQCLVPHVKWVYDGRWSQAATASWRQCLYTLLKHVEAAHDPWVSPQVAVSYLGTKLPGQVMAHFYARVQELRTQEAEGPAEAAVKLALGVGETPKTAQASEAEPDIDFFL